MRFITLIFLLICLMAFFGVGRAVYEDDNTQNIYNFTTQIEWNSSIFPLNNNYSSDNMTQPEINIIRIKNILYKFVDTGGYIALEVSKWGIEFGFNHPEWNYISTMNLIVFAFACMIVGYLTIPVIVLLTACFFLGKAIITFIKNRKFKIPNYKFGYNKKHRRQMK